MSKLKLAIYVNKIVEGKKGVNVDTFFPLTSLEIPFYNPTVA